MTIAEIKFRKLYSRSFFESVCQRKVPTHEVTKVVILKIGSD